MVSNLKPFVGCIMLNRPGQNRAIAGLILERSERAYSLSSDPIVNLGINL